MLERLDKQSRSADQEAALRTKQNSTEKFTRVERRTQLRALKRDSSQSDVHECETSVRHSAKKHKWSERQSTSKSDAKCKDKTHDEQSGPAADETVHEVLEALERGRESYEIPPDV